MQSVVSSRLQPLIRGLPLADVSSILPNIMILTRGGADNPKPLDAARGVKEVKGLHNGVKWPHIVVKPYRYRCKGIVTRRNR